MAADRETRIVKGPLAFEVARFGTPLAVGMALQTTFNLVDAYLIAKLPPEQVGAAVGAIGICDQVAALGTIVSYGVSTAAGAILSQRKGAQDQAGIQRAAWQSMIVIGCLSLFLGLVGGLGAGFIVRHLIGAKGSVAEVATTYLRVSTAGAGTMYFLLQLTNVQRALGSAKTPVALLVVGNILNLVIALLFMFGDGPAPAVLGWMRPVAKAIHLPPMGMVGAAWAAIAARVLVLIPNVYILVRRFDVFPPKGQRAPNGAEIRRLLSIAWPSSAQFFLRISAMLFVNSLIARFFTTQTDQTATTAMGLVFRLDTMALFVAMGWGTCAQTFVGQNLGAKEEKRAKKSGWITAGYDAISNVLLVVVIFAYGESILRIFDDEAGPVRIAVEYLRVVAPSYVGLGIGIVLGNGMAGAGATRTTFAIDAIIVLVIQVPICLFAAIGLDGSLHTIFQCVAITNVASALAYCMVYARGSWVGALARTQ